MYSKKYQPLKRRKTIFDTFNASSTTLNPSQEISSSIVRKFKGFAVKSSYDHLEMNDLEKNDYNNE